MPFVALWSDGSPGFGFSVARVFGIFVAIFVKATKRPRQIQVYPILPGRRLPSGRQLSLRCIPSRLAPFFLLALPLHQHQVRNLFPQTSRWLLLEEPYTLSLLSYSWSDDEAANRFFPARRCSASCSQLWNSYLPGSANTVTGFSSADVQAVTVREVIATSSVMRAWEPRSKRATKA
jgi:hypothetical protein